MNKRNAILDDLTIGKRTSKNTKQAIRRRGQAIAFVGIRKQVLSTQRLPVGGYYRPDNY